MSDKFELFEGDCLEVMKQFPDDYFDACITDPPYGIGIASNPFRQKFNKQEWDNKPATNEMVLECLRVSKHQIIWGGNYFNLPVSQCFYIWDKVQPYNFSSAMCEMAWSNQSKPAKMYSLRVNSYSKQHPTQKPVALMKWCIEQLPDDFETIVDRFMGSGTTGVACAQLGRRFVGIELDPDYFEIAKKRIENAYAQPTLFENIGDKIEIAEQKGLL